MCRLHHIQKTSWRSFTHIRGMATAESSPEVSPKLRTAVILSRTPLITPKLSTFEKSYYNYQQELEKRLMWTFPYWFYYKQGSLEERKFLQAQKHPIGKIPNVHYPDGIPDVKKGRDRRFKQEITIPERQEVELMAAGGTRTEAGEEKPKERAGGLASIKFNPRTTESDIKNDTTALDRTLDRTLYLIIKEKDTYKFPTFDIPEGRKCPPLHTLIYNGLEQIGGPDMNKWVVSTMPAAVYKPKDGSRTYVMKAHIFDGKFVPQKDSNIQEFQWLTREELASKLPEAYYNRLSDQLARI